MGGLKEPRTWELQDSGRAGYRVWLVLIFDKPQTQAQCEGCGFSDQRVLKTDLRTYNKRLCLLVGFRVPCLLKT